MKLYIGCGTIPRDGYINVDPYPCNDTVREGTFQSLGSMFPAESVDEITAEMVLEHIPFNEIGGAIYAAWQVLKPGGMLKLLTPDALAIMGSCVEAPGDMLLWEKANHILLNSFPGMGLGDCHKALISRPYLSGLLSNEGFGNVRFSNIGSRGWGLCTVATKVAHVDRNSLLNVDYGL